MKTVLFFGDSNTYGYNPSDGSRYTENERWTGIIKSQLKNVFSFIEAGCNNRTCFSDNPFGEKYIGSESIKKYMTKNIDVLVLQIGINDVQSIYNNEYIDIEKGVEKLILYAKKVNPEVKIMLICPSVIKEYIFSSLFSSMFDKNSVKKSHYFKKIYSEIAKKYNCLYVNMEEIAQVSAKDGLHYEVSEHKKIAYFIQNMLLSVKT